MMARKSSSLVYLATRLISTRFLTSAKRAEVRKRRWTISDARNYFTIPGAIITACSRVFSRQYRLPRSHCGLISASASRSRSRSPARNSRDSAIMHGRWSKGCALAASICVSPVSTVRTNAKAPLIG